MTRQNAPSWRKDDEPENGQPQDQENDDERTPLLQSLQQLIGEMSSLQKGEQEQRALFRQLEDLLGRMDAKKYPDLLKSPALQRLVDQMQETKAADPNVPPGTIFNRGTLAEHKRPWTRQDLSPDKVPWLEIEPRETIQVTYNGISFWLIGDIRQWVPKPIADVYDESRRNTRLAHEHASFLFNKQAGVPSDPTILSPSSTRIRSTVTQGSFLPGAGVWSEEQATEQLGETPKAG